MLMFGMFRFEAIPVRLGCCLDINIYKSMPRISPEKQTDKNTAGVLNDQMFKKSLFRFRTTNWYLLSVLWLIIKFPGKK